MFFKIGVVKNFAKFTGKNLCQNLLFNKAAGLRPLTLLKLVSDIFYQIFISHQMIALQKL